MAERRHVVQPGLGPVDVGELGQSRRRYTPEQKAALLREHLVDNKPVSEVCTAAEIQPSVFYKWERDLGWRSARERAPSRPRPP